MPVPGAVGVVPLDGLPRREYSVDTVGITLWRDGFGGEAPALRALLRFHAVVARPGRLEVPAGASEAPGAE